LKIGRKPSDEKEIKSSTNTPCLMSRTVEMKPIKGTVAVAKGCFCQEDEGCNVDSGTSSEDEGAYCTESEDRCSKARKREDQNRVEMLSKNIKERAENLMVCRSS
jgi:para-aminobenzoate synthetase